MGKRRERKARRRRVGRVSVYKHRQRWWVYYREHGRPFRRAVADDATAAEQVAAQINLELTSSAPTLFSFRAVSVAALQRSFIDYHEHVVRSSLATVNRYRTATQHLVNFCSRDDGRPAHEVDVEDFVRYLRSVRVAPNGHANARRRPLRDNGVRYILETCRSMYAYAARRRHLPPYTENPFAGLGGKRARIDDAKPVFVFDRQSELAFLKAADGWAFGVCFNVSRGSAVNVAPGNTISVDSSGVINGAGVINGNVQNSDGGEDAIESFSSFPDKLRINGAYTQGRCCRRPERWGRGRGRLSSVSKRSF